MQISEQNSYFGKTIYWKMTSFEEKTTYIYHTSRYTPKDELQHHYIHKIQNTILPILYTNSIISYRLVIT